MISQKYSVSAKTENMIECLKAANRLHELLLDAKLGDKNNAIIEESITRATQPVFDFIYSCFLENIDNCAYNNINEI